MEISTSTLLLLNFALSLIIAWYFRTKFIELLASIEDVENIPASIEQHLLAFTSSALPELPLDDIRDEIVGIMQEMRPPSFVDHIGGAFASILQAKAMSQMQQFSPDLLMPDSVDGD
jgi:hypothetical protein